MYLYFHMFKEYFSPIWVPYPSEIRWMLRKIKEFDFVPFLVNLLSTEHKMFFCNTWQELNWSNHILLVVSSVSWGWSDFCRPIDQYQKKCQVTVCVHLCNNKPSYQLSRQKNCSFLLLKNQKDFHKNGTFTLYFKINSISLLLSLKNGLDFKCQVYLILFCKVNF